MDWYLVVYTPEKYIRSDAMRQYRGIDGIAWPLESPAALVSEINVAAYAPLRRRRALSD